MQVSVSRFPELPYCLVELPPRTYVAIYRSLTVKFKELADDASFEPPVPFVVRLEGFDDENFWFSIHDSSLEIDSPNAENSET